MGTDGDDDRDRAFADEMIDYHHEIGKWMIASLFILNAAPLAALSQSKLSVPPLPCLFLLFGIYNALSSGFFSWLNAGKRSGVLPAPSPTATGIEARLIRIALACPMRCTVLFGMLSATCFFVGSLWIALVIAGTPAAAG